MPRLVLRLLPWRLLWATQLPVLLLLLRPAPGATATAAAQPPASPTTPCAAYSELYAAVDIVAKRIASMGGMHPSNLTKASEWCTGEPENCAVLKVHAGQLYVVFRAKRAFQTRLQSSMLLLYRTLASFSGEIPDVDLVLNVDDTPGPPTTWSFCNTASGRTANWIYPDWGFVMWPEILSRQPWALVADEIFAAGAATPYQQKIGKIFWRGVDLCPSRKELLRRLGPRTDIADVVAINWKQVHQAGAVANSTPYLALQDFCKYRYIVYTEGYSWSARLKYILLCQSTVISHPLRWADMLTPLLRPADVVFVGGRGGRQGGSKQTGSQGAHRRPVADGRGGHAGGGAIGGDDGGGARREMHGHQKRSSGQGQGAGRGGGGDGAAAADAFWGGIEDAYAQHEGDLAAAAARARSTSERFQRLLRPRGVECYVRELLLRYASLQQWVVDAPGPGAVPFEELLITRV